MEQDKTLKANSATGDAERHPQLAASRLHYAAQGGLHLATIGYRRDKRVFPGSNKIQLFADECMKSGVVPMSRPLSCTLPTENGVLSMAATRRQS